MKSNGINETISFHTYAVKIINFSNNLDIIEIASKKRSSINIIEKENTIEKISNFKEIKEYFDDVNQYKSYYKSNKYLFSFDKNINEDEELKYESLNKISKEIEIRGINKNTIFIHNDTFLSICPEISMSSTIKHLDVSNNYLSDDDFKELFAGLPNMINLKYLNLSRNNFTDLKGINLNNRLIMKNLKTVDISNNSFFEQEFNGFLRMFKYICPNLICLIMVNNNLGIKEDILYDLQFFPKLKTLILKNNNFHFKSISEIIIKTIRGFNELENLVICENIILDNKLSNFIGSLSKLSHLELNMKRENNSENYCNHLLTDLKNLTHLNLSNLSIDNSFLIHSKSQIREMNKLKYLNLSYNNISNEGGYEISKLLPKLSDLSYLDLSHNKLGRSNLEIFSSLKFMNNLNILILENTQINDESAKQLNFTIKVLRKLRLLNLKQNNFNQNIIYFTSKILSDLCIIYE